MKDTERLLGALEEFKTTTIERLSKIETRLDDLWGFRMKMLGAVSLAGCLGGALVAYLTGVR